MSQHDFEITTEDANSGPSMRAAINEALQALASNSLGLTEPAFTYAGMWWYDTTAGVLKQRDATNTLWFTYQLSVKDVQSLQLGLNGTGDRDSFLDLHSDDVNLKSSRIQRLSGEDGNLDIENFGTGDINLNPESGDVKIDSNLVHHAGQDSGWITASYQNSWLTAASSPDASYRKLPSGLVVIRGVVTSGSVGTTVYTLPVGYRPAYSLGVPITVVDVGVSSTMVLSVGDNGEIKIFEDSTGVASAVAYQLNASFMSD